MKGRADVSAKAQQRHLADCGKLVSGSESARGNPRLHLVDDLPVDRNAALEIQCEPERRGRIGLVLLHLECE